MKSTLKVLGVFLLCFVGLVACTSKDDSASKVQVELPDPLATRSVFWEDNVLLKAHLVFSEMLPEIVRSYLDPKRFGNIDQYSLIVISEEEKNLIYVVNFDGGGWALISGIFLEEGPILAYSFSGVFNPESIRSPEVTFWLESTKQFIAELIDDVFLDNTRSENQTCTEDSEIHSASRSFGDSYFWVQVPIDTTVATTTYSSVSPLLSTKWGQEYPWNYMCPTINGEQCLTGCVSVAYAQELYYLHDYLGEPTTLYHQIDTCYDWHLNYYLPMHTLTNRVSSSSRWNEMPLINPGYQTTGTNYVGDLMIELGQQVLMKYYYNLSEAALNSALFSNYGLSASCADFDSTIAISQLNNSIPIIIGAYRTPPALGGHAWVIDGHLTTQTTWVLSLQWRRLPEEFMNDYLDYIRYSDREMRLLFPNVIENQIDHEYHYYYNSVFCMNWGWDGEDDGYYTMSTIPYPYQPRMIYNFQLQGQ